MRCGNEKIDLQLDGQGAITGLKIEGTRLPFREDYYRGVSLFAVTGETEERIFMTRDSEDKPVWKGSLYGVEFSLEYAFEGRNVHVLISASNTSQSTSPFRRIFARIGIDSYMDSFPAWNERYFPTMLRCEKTHFYGYMMSPAGDIFAIASKDPLVSWSLDYNRALYGAERHVGHRIYTVCLDLLNTSPQPERHPESGPLEDGKTVKAELVFTHLKDLGEFDGFVKDVTGAPLIKFGRYTLTPSEQVRIMTDGEISVIGPDGTDSGPGNFTRCGTYTVRSSNNGKITEGKLYIRKPWSWYLKRAAEAALEFPQKASTHAETWYGFFSGFLAVKHGLMNEDYRKSLIAEFERIFALMFRGNPLRPVEETDPGRIQNTAAMISLLTDAYEATGEKKYLGRAGQLADFLMSFQGKDGAFRSGEGIHYTCVIYPAKSLLELYLCARENESLRDLARKCYDSAVRAIDNLALLGDNIQTEGEQTFEDGMISCESLQLGMLALISGKSIYADVARQVLKKHKCLEQSYIPDCRMHGATLRFWESMYDVLINRNMINSPHGWTSWKTYATFYLYLLTGEYEYLEDTMNTLGACVQCVDIESGRLRWAFVTDPCIETDIFVKRGDTGFGELRPGVISEQYVDMISGWWHSGDYVANGYSYPDIGRVDGIYKGGCCDNDVHEHFKCLEEVALCNAFVHELPDGTIVAYNCTVGSDGEIELSEDLIDTVFIHTSKPAGAFTVKGRTYEAHTQHNGFSVLKLKS